jgi:hypothetical protein
MDQYPSPEQDIEIDCENVVYFDEYVHLEKKLWLRRLQEQRVAKTIGKSAVIYKFERPGPTIDS